MAEFVADAVRDTTFGQQIGGYIVNSPSSNQSITSEFIYVTRELINLSSSTNIVSGNINFEIHNDLTGRLPMANLFQTYKVLKWEGFLTFYFPDAYVTAGSEILVLAAPYSRGPFLLRSNTASLYGLNISNLPGASAKLIRGSSLQNGMELGNALKIINEEPMYQIRSYAAGSISSQENGQLPSMQPLQLEFIDGGDTTAWQVGIWHAENVTSNYVASIMEVTYLAKVTIKFEGIKWGIRTFPTPTSVTAKSEYLLCDHCGHKAVTKGEHYLEDTRSALSRGSRRGWGGRICSGQEESLPLPDKIQNEEEEKPGDMHSKNSKRRGMGIAYPNKTFSWDLEYQPCSPKIQELHAQEGQGFKQTSTNSQRIEIGENNKTD